MRKHLCVAYVCLVYMCASFYVHQSMCDVHQFMAPVLIFLDKAPVLIFARNITHVHGVTFVYLYLHAFHFIKLSNEFK